MPFCFFNSRRARLTGDYPHALCYNSQAAGYIGSGVIGFGEAAAGGGVHSRPRYFSLSRGMSEQVSSHQQTAAHHINPYHHGDVQTTLSMQFHQGIYTYSHVSPTRAHPREQRIVADSTTPADHHDDMGIGGKALDNTLGGGYGGPGRSNNNAVVSPSPTLPPPTLPPLLAVETGGALDAPYPYTRAHSVAGSHPLEQHASTPLGAGRKSGRTRADAAAWTSTGRRTSANGAQGGALRRRRKVAVPEADDDEPNGEHDRGRAGRGGVVVAAAEGRHRHRHPGKADGAAAG